jgi:hypothetical protein
MPKAGLSKQFSNHYNIIRQDKPGRPGNEKENLKHRKDKSLRVNQPAWSLSSIELHSFMDGF